MTKISDRNIKKLKEQILSVIYTSHFNPLFTSNIAEEMIRDEEFTLRLLNELKKEGFIEEITKNTNGKKYISRKKWILKSKIYDQYKLLSN